MKGPFEIHYTTRARSDMRDIYTYLAFSRREKAKWLVGRIRKEIRSLETLPERFRIVGRGVGGPAGARQMPVGRYLVYYLVDSQLMRVYVLRIVYGGRNLENILIDD